MSFFTDAHYINLLSGSLRNFKQKTPELYNCSCPFCGDSQKDKTKARGYFFRDGDRFGFKCHNCGLSTSTGAVIRLVNPSLFMEYRLEKFKDNTFRPKMVKSKKIELVEEPINIIEKKVISSKLTSILDLPDNHKAKDYILKRQVPDLSRVYYTDNWNTFVVTEFGDKYKDAPSDERIVLPFINQNKELIGAQGRSLSRTGIRYITAKKENNNLVFGLDNWDKFKHTYVFEGPIDSLFVENGLAVASSDLKSIFTRFPLLDKDKTTLVFDNEPRSKEILKLMSECIELGYNICIHSNILESKDINDMIKKGELTQEGVMCYLQERTFKNLQAKLLFQDWKQI